MTWKFDHEGTSTSDNYKALRDFFFSEDSEDENRTSVEPTNNEDGVRSIEDFAFDDSNGMKNSTIQKSVRADDITWTLDHKGTVTIHNNEDMHDFAHSRVTWLLHRNREEIQSVIIMDGVTSIEAFAFQNCPNLTSVTIPDSVESIGFHAFAGCEKLPGIRIPKSVTSLDYSVFFGCKSLTSIEVDPENEHYSSDDGVLFNKEQTVLILYPMRKKGKYTLPSTVTAIKYTAFYNCRKLTGFEAAPESENYSSDDGILFNKDQTMLVKCPMKRKGKYVVIPSTVTSIGPGAFNRCKRLKSIEIPDSVTNIEACAFDGCKKLKSITIPEGVTKIAEGTFFGCSRLKEITIPDRVSSIGKWAFKDCKRLKSISIGTNVTCIVEGAFSDCSSLKDVYYAGNIKQWHSIEISVDNYFLKEAVIHCKDGTIQYESKFPLDL